MRKCFYLSHLNFYNLIAGVTLAPALVAACMGLVRGRRQGLLAPVIGVLWTLLILGGDPQTALLALLLAGAAMVLVWRERPAGSDWSTLGLLAAPSAGRTCWATAPSGALSSSPACRPTISPSIPGSWRWR